MHQTQATSDKDIRSALHSKYLRAPKESKGTLIIDELGLAHSRARVDIAVINRSIHGYEIKSEVDNLDRLGVQLETYRRTLQKLTIVAAPKHMAAVKNSTPNWCGLIEASRGSRGAIGFNVYRSPSLNPDIDPVMMAHLLWREEVIELLSSANVPAKEMRVPRKQLYEVLCDILTINELAQTIREIMIRRRMWRERHAPVLCGG